MKFLKEQSGNHAYHLHLYIYQPFDIYCAPICLCKTARFILGNIGKACPINLELMFFCISTLGVFKAIISGVLDPFQKLTGEDLLQKKKDKIDCAVNELLNQALRLDPQPLIEENRADAADVLG